MKTDSFDRFSALTKLDEVRESLTEIGAMEKVFVVPIQEAIRTRTEERG
jgi:nitrogen regulatory protein PII